MTWPIRTLDEIFEIARGGSPRPIDQFITDADDGVNWIMIGDASNSSKYIRETKKKIKPSGVSRSRLVKPGDFLLTNSMSFGRPYILDTHGCIHDGWLVLSPRRSNVDHDYFYHLLGSPAIFGQFEKLAAGATVKNLNIDLVKSVVVAVPPLEEQKRIAAILDQADELRRKRQRALDRLNQLGQAIFLEMFEADSEYQALGSVCHVSSGSTPSRDNPAYYVGDIPWVKTGEVNGTRIRSTSERVSDEAKRTFRLKLYPAGTVLLAMYGQGKTRGQVGVLDIPATTNQACAAITCFGKILPDFLFFQLKLGYEVIRAMGRGGNQPNLNAGMVKEIPIVVPPLERQKLFVERLRQLETIERCCSRQLHAIPSLFTSLQHRAFRGELTASSLKDAAA